MASFLLSVSENSQCRASGHVCTFGNVQTEHITVLVNLKHFNLYPLSLFVIGDAIQGTLTREPQKNGHVGLRKSLWEPRGSEARSETSLLICKCRLVIEQRGEDRESRSVKKQSVVPPQEALFLYLTGQVLLFIFASTRTVGRRAGVTRQVQLCIFGLFRWVGRPAGVWLTIIRSSRGSYKIQSNLVPSTQCSTHLTPKSMLTPLPSATNAWETIQSLTSACSFEPHTRAFKQQWATNPSPTKILFRVHKDAKPNTSDSIPIIYNTKRFHGSSWWQSD